MAGTSPAMTALVEGTRVVVIAIRISCGRQADAADLTRREI
jgi:hypothetical protein